MKDRTRYLSALTAFVLLIGMASVGTMVTSQYVQPGGSNGTASGENVTLSGTVTDGTDGISGAEIALYGGDVFYPCEDERNLWMPYWYHSTKTAEDGTFEIELPSGNYSLNVLAEGFESHYDWIDISEDTEIEIELTGYTAVMTGYVASTDGDAISDAYISVYTAWDWRDECRDDHDEDCFHEQERYDGAGCVISDIDYQYFFAYTDDDGHYTLYGLPGEYEVSVWAYGFSSLYDEVELVEGETEMDFVLEDQTAYVEGWVYDEQTGDPIEGALVTLEYFPVFMEYGPERSDYSWDDIDIWDGVEILFHYTTETDDEGRFEFELEADEMWMYGYLTVEAEDYKLYETDLFIEEYVEIEVLLESDSNEGGSGYITEYEYEYIDENDDGNPEYIYEHKVVYEGYWLIYEYEYIYEDADSDGNPEYEYEYETGKDIDDEDPVKDRDDDVDKDDVFKPLKPGDKDAPEREVTDPEDEGGDIWAEGKGSSGAGTDVHTRGIAFVMTIALVGGAFLLLIRRR